MNLREKKRATRKKNIMVEKERSKHRETQESSSKEKRQKNIIKKKKRNYWPQGKLYSVFHQAPHSQDYFMLAANINVPEYSKIKATHAGCKLL